MIVLVIGGTRSGKSAFAEDLAAALGEPITYVATGVVTDPDMAQRVQRHRERRPPGWHTIEATGDALASRLRTVEGPVLLDALGTWVASFPDLAPPTAELTAVLTDRPGLTIVVTDEVGLGVHPATEIGRRFRDAIGTVNQAVGEIADEVVLMVAGRALRLDSPAETTAALRARLSQHTAAES